MRNMEMPCVLEFVSHELYLWRDVVKLSDSDWFFTSDKLFVRSSVDHCFSLILCSG